MEDNKGISNLGFVMQIGWSTRILFLVLLGTKNIGHRGFGQVVTRRACQKPIAHFRVARGRNNCVCLSSSVFIIYAFNLLLNASTVKIGVIFDRGALIS